MRAGLVLGVALVGLTGCASTRSIEFGLIAPDRPLVTLVVSEDRDLVKRECQAAASRMQVLGCQMSKIVTLPGDVIAKTVKIVRFTDSLPSPMALEIDAHELCHTVASLQGLIDPCHEGNNGLLQSLVSKPSLNW